MKSDLQNRPDFTFNPGDVVEFRNITATKTWPSGFDTGIFIEYLRQGTGSTLDDLVCIEVDGGDQLMLSLPGITPMGYYQDPILEELRNI